MATPAMVGQPSVHRYPGRLESPSTTQGTCISADTFNNVVREVTVSNGFIATVAGNQDGNMSVSGGYSGDGGAATAAELKAAQSSGRRPRW